MKDEDYVRLSKLCVIRNSISLICFTLLSIAFNHWWIIFFSAFFISYVERDNR